MIYLTIKNTFHKSKVFFPSHEVLRLLKIYMKCANVVVGNQASMRKRDFFKYGM
jgi:hypothetical protein